MQRGLRESADASLRHVRIRLQTQFHDLLMYIVDAKVKPSNLPRMAVPVPPHISCVVVDYPKPNVL